MFERTVALLDAFEGTEWFANVGRQTTDRCAYVEGWPEAVERCGSNDWLDLCQEAVNGYRHTLRVCAPEPLESWNEHVNELKAHTDPLVLSKTRSVIEVNQLPRIFLDVVRWDLLHICLESEFADYIPPRFYTAQSRWYLDGHFPCGWKGRFPMGQVVVF